MKLLFGHFLNSSIKTKIIAMGMLLCILSVCMMAIAASVLNVKEIKNNILDELTIISTIIGKRSKAGIVYSQFDNVQKNLEDIQSISYIDSACIYDIDKQLIAKYNKLAPGSGNFCTSTETIINSGVHFIDHNVISKQSILSDEDEPIGSIVFYGNLSKFYEKFLSLFIEVMVIMSITLLVTYFIANYLQEVISRPIIELTKLTQSVAQGSYDIQVLAQHSDEVGELTESFNYMLNEINERDKQLNDININLEKKVEERTKDLEFSIKQLQKANDAKKIWIQNIGHELRTPIHAINSFADIGKRRLSKSPIDFEKIEGAFDRIIISGKRLTILINDLLDFGKMESGKLSFSFKGCYIKDIIDQSVNETEILFRNKNIEVQVEYIDNLMIECDQNRIIQVMLNLLSNAVKFSPDNARISIASKRDIMKTKSGGDVDALTVSVSDQGVGVPENELDSIFDTFVQSSKTVDGSGGTGLGLAICREIVSAHNGTICCKNNVDRGAIFTVILPLKTNAGNA
jgi:signal transduction histidine kinase